jgi:hypothetical protein
MAIIFEEKLSKIGSQLIIILPLEISEKLPSRGMVMIQGTMNNVAFKGPLEPDGKGSHWLEVSPPLSKNLGITVDDTVSFNIDALDEWFEPEIPEDLMNEIVKADVLNQWNSITIQAQ